eukprot:1152473-Pelagomonas_calceolata.AAC.1
MAHESVALSECKHECDIPPSAPSTPCMPAPLHCGPLNVDTNVTSSPLLPLLPVPRHPCAEWSPALVQPPQPPHYNNRCGTLLSASSSTHVQAPLRCGPLHGLLRLCSRHGSLSIQEVPSPPYLLQPAVAAAEQQAAHSSHVADKSDMHAPARQGWRQGHQAHATAAAHTHVPLPSLVLSRSWHEAVNGAPTLPDFAPAEHGGSGVGADGVVMGTPYDFLHWAIAAQAALGSQEVGACVCVCVCV